MTGFACHVRVTGRVQGVFFRQWTVEQARALGVTGWVRNCDDGSVEAHVEGQESKVNSLIERMRRGPRAAHVEDLEIGQAEPSDSANFTVSR